MRYVGGKSRIAKWIASEIAKVKGDRSVYVEPFAGGLNSFEECAPLFERAVASDAHPDLIMMWQELLFGGWVPPESVLKDEYDALRRESPSALRGLVGFGASFGGKWFGGYAGSVWDRHNERMTRPFYDTAKDAVEKTAKRLRGLDIAVLCRDYRELSIPRNSVVYCDPPYAGTLGYGVEFDSASFWSTASKWASDGALVIVSEQSAPDGWKVLAERTRKHMLRVADSEENKCRREALFVKEI